jgi:hypothetical protein
MSQRLTSNNQQKPGGFRMRHFAAIMALAGQDLQQQRAPMPYIDPSVVMNAIRQGELVKGRPHSIALTMLKGRDTVTDNDVKRWLSGITGSGENDVVTSQVIAAFAYSSSPAGRDEMASLAQAAFKKVRRSEGFFSDDICRYLAFYRDGVEDTVHNSRPDGRSERDVAVGAAIAKQGGDQRRQHLQV